MTSLTLSVELVSVVEGKRWWSMVVVVQVMGGGRVTKHPSMMCVSNC